MSLPNFILAGTNSAGTTALYHQLRQHPQIYLSPVKEPTSFAAADMLVRPAFRNSITRHRAALQAYLAGPMDQIRHFWVPEWKDYVQLFRNVRDHKAIGEGSVNYFWLPGAAAAIRSKLPDVRLIVLLRNPSERAFSWYLQNLATHPGLTFRDWFLEAREPGGDGATANGRFTLPFDGCWYTPNVRRFFDHFPRRQIRIYLHDDYRADGRAVLRDICEFLGVDPDQPIDTTRRVNETLVPRFPLVETLRRRFLRHIPLTLWLPDRVGRAVRAWYRRGRTAYRMTPDDRRLVIDFYRDEIGRTADLIGRDLSAWLR